MTKGVPFESNRPIYEERHLPVISRLLFSKMAKNTNIRISLPAVCFVWQIAMIILFGVFIRYNEESDTHWIEHRRRKNISTNLENDFYYRYPSK